MSSTMRPPAHKSSLTGGDRNAGATGDRRAVASPFGDELRREAVRARDEHGNTDFYALLSDAAERHDAMLAALIQCTSRADARLKKHFSGRTDECARDYSKCIAAIARATGVSENTAAVGDRPEAATGEAPS